MVLICISGPDLALFMHFMVDNFVTSIENMFYTYFCIYLSFFEKRDLHLYMDRAL